MHEQRRNRTWRVALVVAATAAIVAPATAFASHQFTDVPNSNTFHADIDWMADNGVTKGCNPPTNDEYCPKDLVTREQMAAFMHRLETEGVFLPTDGTAANAGLLDGMDSSDFLSSDLDGLVPIARFQLDDDTIGGVQWRAPLSGPPTATYEDGPQRYRVDLPGVSWNFTDDSDQVTCTSAINDLFASTNSVGGDLLVFVTNDTGGRVNAEANCVVWSAD